MADFKISDLPLAATMTGTELMEVVQGGVSKKAGVDEAFKRFGLGWHMASGSNTDPNPTGFYYNIANATALGSGPFFLDVKYEAGNFAAFRLSTNTYSYDIYWQPGWGGGVFGLKPAVKMLHTGNMVGTVSQSGGVPTLTSAIIERGSNANGSYVKYADGTMICLYIAAFTIPNSSELSVTWTFPSTFIDTGYASIAQWKGPAPGQAAVFYNNTSHTVNSVTFTAATIDGSVFSAVGLIREGAFVAIGRWY